MCVCVCVYMCVCARLCVYAPVPYEEYSIAINYNYLTNKATFPVSTYFARFTLTESVKIIGVVFITLLPLDTTLPFQSIICKQVAKVLQHS